MSQSRRGKSIRLDTKPKPRHRKVPDGVAMESFLIHGPSISEKWDFRHHVIPPISSSVTYRLEDTERGGQGFREYASGEAHRTGPIYIYDRLDEPTRGMLEDELAGVEGGDNCVCFATGMAAISAALGITLKAGDELVAHKTLYGCTYSLITNWYPKLNISARLIDLRDAAALEKSITPKTRCVYFETPVNPTMELIDIAAVAEVVRRVNDKRKEGEKIYIIVDNTFATPFCQRPLALGAHIVVHSLTKNIGGFGTDMGGAVIAPHELEGQLLLYRKDFGGALAPKSAWPILVYGLPTLPLRLKKQQESAYEVARFLRGHPKVKRVAYPGLEDHPQFALAKQQMRDLHGEFAPGNMIYFETIEKGAEPKNSVKVVDWIAKNGYALTLAVSLGQLRSLIENPGAMTHAAVPAEKRAEGGIAPNGIRLSIGIEHPDDIIRDLERGLELAD
ncbi:MAG TPA: aminotransferase class I/II-fold pyridoxal phosphate-dependent enzyme [Planctomycetota bacterium]|nr:aminotransferase class I/II-fold pyridoxal phosphate-dependent enzyme [Planctomycetota bacterium]